MSTDKEEAAPSWAVEPTTTQKDDKNDSGDETTPLFGTGPVSLQDQENDEEAPALTYGTIPKETEAEKEEAEEEEKLGGWHDESQDKPVNKKKKHSKNGKKDDDKNKTKYPRKNCCLHFFTFIQIIAIVACLGLLLTQVLPLFLVPLNQFGVLQLALRVYVSFFSLIFVLVEFETPIPCLNSALLQNFFLRGFLYSFVGLVGMEEAYEVILANIENQGGGGHLYDEFHISWAPLFIKSASWLMVVAGIIYMVLGALCLKRLRDGMRRNYKEATARYEEENK